MKKRKDALRVFRSRIPRAVGVTTTLAIIFWATSGFKVSDVWVAPVTLGALTVLLLPTILVQVYDLRVKRPKPVFIEPNPIKMGVVFILWAAITFVLIGLLAEAFNIPERYIGWELLIWSAVTLGVPINAYMVYIFTRYKRVVEYGTAEWKRLHNRI